MIETDAEVVERVKREWDGDNVPCVEDFDQLIALARRGAAVQWRPIEEAPKDGTWILVGAPGKEPETACWSSSVWLEGWYSGGGRSDSYGPSFEPTHWMPLPPPPKGAEE